MPWWKLCTYMENMLYHLEIIDKDEWYDFDLDDLMQGYWDEE